MSRKINQEEALTLIGKTYERLTVLDLVGRDRWGSWLYNCLCSCGHKITTTKNSLMRKNTRSCGCFRSESSSLRMKKNWPEGLNKGEIKTEFGFSSMNSLYISYRYNARKKKVPFEITIEDFFNITQKDCFYCGSGPSSFYHAKNCNGPYIYNGMDRISPQLGYTLTNLVSCCRTCNWMKSDLTLEIFKNHLLKIVEHLGIRKEK